MVITQRLIVTRLTSLTPKVKMDMGKRLEASGSRR